MLSGFSSSFYILWNLTSSISIVIINKWIFVHHQFPSITLTFLHFTFTAIGLKICASLNVFNPRSVQVKQMLPLSVSFCGFVVLTNLSLKHNTVGTYQLIKVLTTPCIMIIQYAFYKKTYQPAVISTLVPITFGIFLNCYYDVQLNFIGIVYGLLGVVVTSVYQVWVGQIQKDLNISSIQLLNYQAPLSALVLLFFIPWFEPITATYKLVWAWTLTPWLLVTLSALVAFFINLTVFWIIGNMSPVTYNMIGHLKFCVTLFVAYMVFKNELTSLQLVGILSTFIGIFAYSQLKYKENQTKVNLSRNV